MNSKSIFASKTMALNTIVMLTALFPPAAQFVASNPQESVFLLGGLNLILRLATKKKVQLFPMDN